MNLAKSIVHKRHEKHEKILYRDFFDCFFRVFRGPYFFLQIDLLMECSFLGVD